MEETIKDNKEYFISIKNKPKKENIEKIEVKELKDLLNIAIINQTHILYKKIEKKYEFYIILNHEIYTYHT